MARSVFCAAPPGQTQDSVRVFRAIIKGCIPVTFYRGNDRPFERHLRVPWDAFSVKCSRTTMISSTGSYKASWMIQEAAGAAECSCGGAKAVCVGPKS